MNMNCLGLKSRSMMRDVAFAHAQLCEEEAYWIGGLGPQSESWPDGRP